LGEHAPRPVILLLFVAGCPVASPVSRPNYVTRNECAAKAA
jgi:hypothetical protein